MARLSGLSGLYAPDPPETTMYMDEGVLEAKAFTPDSEHGEYGSQSLGYQGIVPDQNPYSGFPVYDGFSRDASAAYGGREFNVGGTVTDRTPDSHAAPYPRGIRQQSWSNPDGLAAAGDQLQVLHGTDMGGPRNYTGDDPAGHEEEAHYTTDRYEAPNENHLSPDVPGQLRGSTGRSGGGYNSGTADTTQGYGVLNSIPEFQAGHSIRRVQHDTVHFDYTNTHGEQDVPFYGRHPVQQMPLNGPDSPYFEAGDISGANIPWEGRIGDPAPYTQPAEPSFGPALSDYGPSPFAWG
jgi:hypothetical protein